MLRVKRNIVVDASVDTVFNYLVDFSRHREWNANHGNSPAFTDPTEAGHNGEASGTDMSSLGPGRDGESQKDLKLTLTDFAPNRRLAFETSAVRGCFEEITFFQFEPADDRTRIMKGTDLVLPKEIRPYVLIPFTWPFILASIPVDLFGLWWKHGVHLRRIKKLLESMK